MISEVFKINDFLKGIAKYLSKIIPNIIIIKVHKIKYIKLLNIAIIESMKVEVMYNIETLL